MDALGSPIALTDASGTVQTQYAYEPFGKTTQSGAASSNPSQYTGRDNDGTGLYYYRARYYSPTSQRFIAEDPVGVLGGINLYAYALNNPISFTDPSGLSAIGDFIGGVLTAHPFARLPRERNPWEPSWGTPGDFTIPWKVNTHTCWFKWGVYTGIAVTIVAAVAVPMLGPELEAEAAAAGAEAEAAAEAEAGASASGVCFLAGTTVLTPEGERAIEELKPGDDIISKEPSCDFGAKETITHTFVRNARVVLDIRIGSETITVTPEHPFWVPGQGWVRADGLVSGSPLLAHDNSIVQVDAINRREGLFNVYNIEVASAHTYQVSGLGILVHNQCQRGGGGVPKGPPKPSPNFEPPTNPAALPPTDIPAGWRVREMPPTDQYPNGYWKLEKPMKDGGWQPIDPSTGKPGGRPQTHIPFPPKGKP